MRVGFLQLPYFKPCLFHAPILCRCMIFSSHLYSHTSCILHIKVYFPHEGICLYFTLSTHAFYVHIHVIYTCILFMHIPYRHRHFSHITSNAYIKGCNSPIFPTTCKCCPVVSHFVISFTRDKCKTTKTSDNFKT